MLKKFDLVMKRNLGTAILLLGDFMTLLLALQGALYLREYVLPLFLDFPEFPPIDYRYFWWIFPAWIFFLVYEGLYTRRFSFWDEVKALWKVIAFATLAAFSILYLGKVGEQFSRTVLVVTGIMALPLFPIIRTNIRRLLVTAGLLNSKVLILGAGKTGELIFNALKHDINLGLKVVGFLDDDPDKWGRTIGGIKIHRGVYNARQYIGRCGIDNVVIAMPGCNKDKILELVNRLQHKARNILLIPDLFGITVMGTNLQHFFQEQAIGLEVRNNLAQPLNRLIKKLFDMTASVIFLAVLSLPMLLIALLIRMTSKGPAIFSQARVGKKGSIFQCYKFRTMYYDADTRLEQLLKNDPGARHEWNSRWKLAADPRITPVGKFLRQTSLDELPQIFNVLTGRMSLVGPRPVTRAEIDEHYREQAALCFVVPPGITGLWQVSGRSNTSYKYRIALDSWYVRNWNIWLDIVILFKTVRVVIRREGAV